MKDFLKSTRLLGFARGAEGSTLNFSIYGLSIDITQYGYYCSPTFGEHCD